MVTSGRSFSRAARSVRRRFSSSASCEESSRLSTVCRAGFPYRRLVARQRGKRRELCGSVVHRHLRMVLQDVVRQADDVIIERFHFRCPPICSFRSLPVAPSTKFVPFSSIFSGEDTNPRLLKQHHRGKHYPQDFSKKQKF